MRIVLPLGPEPAETIAGWFYLNWNNYQQWQQAVNEGCKPVMMLVKPDARFYFFRAMATALEQGWMDLAPMERTYGVMLRPILFPLLEQWCCAGLVFRCR